jgi:mannose-1-phosphate guanylyltransferase
LDFHEKSAGIGTISMWEVENPTRYGTIGYDSENRIQKFLEKPQPHEVFSNWINAGVYVLEPEILDLMTPDKVISIEREIFPPLASQHKLFGFKFYGYWMDAGTPSAYLKTHQALFDKEKNPEKFDLLENTKINTPVLIGKNCKIAEDSELGPYTCIGDNVTVSEKTKISNTIILGDSIIGRNNHLENAIIGYGITIEDNVTIGEGVVVGDNQVLRKGDKIPNDSRIGGP